MGRNDTEQDAAAVYVAGAVADAKTIDDLREQLTAATARAEKAEALYAKAWEECERWREKCGGQTEAQPTEPTAWMCFFTVTGRGDEPDYESWDIVPQADAHDAARREAGL